MRKQLLDLCDEWTAAAGYVGHGSHHDVLLSCADSVRRIVAAQAVSVDHVIAELRAGADPEMQKAAALMLEKAQKEIKRLLDQEIADLKLRESIDRLRHG